jgi:hypothetical protein
MEIVEDRNGRGSILITSQLPVTAWHDVIDEPTFADAILAFLRETIPQEWKKFRDKVSDNFRVITHENFRVLK